MKKWTLLIVVNFIVQSLAAQYLDVNNIRALFHCNGEMFWNKVTGARYEFPKVSEPGDISKHTIFAANLWIGGLDENDSLFLSAEEHGQDGNDFYEGPVGNIYTPWDARFCRDLAIYRHEVEEKKANPSSNISKFYDWPAHGDTTNGETFQMAPFVDLNENGIYEPGLGEYPLVRGDMARYFVYNDLAPGTRYTGENRMGLEIHSMPYAYSSSSTYLDNTIFINYNIHNRSGRNYKDVYIGLWVDFDIGYAYDDFIGCDTVLNAFYGYNGDNFDPGLTGYGSHPPTQAAVLLNHPMKSFIAYNKDFTATGNPQSPGHFYNYLKAIWKDDTPLTYGGTGKGGSTIIKFQYPGNPANNNEWSEVSASNTPQDRRGLGVVGPLTLAAGEKICFDVAFVSARLTIGGALGSIPKLKEEIQLVQNFYNSRSYKCVNDPSVSIRNPGNAIHDIIRVYPNPSENIFNVQINKLEMGLLILQVYNVQGKLIKTVRPSQAEFTIDLSSFSKGIYFLKILTERDVVTKKLVLE